jgi:hypothetical protein
MINYYIQIDDEDHKHWTLCRVVDQLTERLYLVRSLDPRTGEPNKAGMWVLDVEMLAQVTDQYGPRGRIFETYLALQEYIDWDPEPWPEEAEQEAQVH